MRCLLDPMVKAAEPYILRAIHDIATKNGNDIPSALLEFLQHINANKAFVSPVLSGGLGPVTN